MPKSDFRFFFPFRIRYSEVDQQKVVFNAHYLTYFDTTIAEFFRMLGYDYMGEVERTGVDFHVVKSLIEYREPIRYDQEIEVHIRVARIGRSSVTFELEIHPKEADRALARGEIIWVAADQATHRSVAVPEPLSALLERHEGRPLRG